MHTSSLFVAAVLADVLYTALADLDPLAIGSVAVVDKPPVNPELVWLQIPPLAHRTADYRRHTVFTLSHSKNLRMNDATHEQRSESILMHLCNDLFAFVLPYFVRAGYAYPSIHGPSAGAQCARVVDRVRDRQLRGYRCQQ
jgi:hypothetical protein